MLHWYLFTFKPDFNLCPSPTTHTSYTTMGYWYHLDFIQMIEYLPFQNTYTYVYPSLHSENDRAGRDRRSMSVTVKSDIFAIFSPSILPWGYCVLYWAEVGGEPCAMGRGWVGLTPSDGRRGQRRLQNTLRSEKSDKLNFSTRLEWTIAQINPPLSAR